MFLGIDLGTSSLKMVLVDEAQRLIASHNQALTVQRPHQSWSEQVPNDWLEACDKAAAALHQQQPKAWASLKAIGLSGQMHGATLLDGADRPLRPCLLWNDGRSEAEARELDANPLFRNLTGTMVFAGFTAPKLLWVKRHEPQIFAAIRRVLLPKDFLRLYLTGEAVSDMSDASGTSWLDCASRNWSPPLLAACSLGLDSMPRLVEGSEISGNIRPAIARKWGLDTSVIVAGGAGDNAAAAIGLGAVEEGVGFVSLGTSGVIFAPMNRFAPRADSALHSFCHALPSLWHQMGVILTAVDALDWLAQFTNANPALLTDELTAIVKGQECRPSSLLCLPYLNGERTPHNDAKVRGSFIGLDRAHARHDLTKAVMEGVAFALADNFELIQNSGANLSELIAVGGGGQARLWLEMLANLTQCPIKVPADVSVGAALGAARLAMLAANHGSLETIAIRPAIISEITANPSLADEWYGAWQRYKQAFPLTKQAMGLDK